MHWSADPEKEQMARKDAEKSGLGDGKNALNDVLLRIKKLETSQENDRKEMQQLSGEVKSTIETVRATVNTAETIRGLYLDLNAKVNQMANGPGKNSRLQNGLKTVQSTVSTIEKEMFSLSSRSTALEKQCLELQQGFQRLEQSCQRAPVLAPAPIPTNAPQRLRKLPTKTQPPSRTQQATATDTRDVATANRSWRTEVIPVTSPARPSVTVKMPRKSPDNVAAPEPKRANNAEGKDGSDITVQEDGAVPRDLLASIVHLHQKEKRAHEKMGSKLAELEKAFGPFDPPVKKRKHAHGSEGQRKRSRKAKPASATEKEKCPWVLTDDSDSEVALLYEQYLEAKKNLLTPTLPVIPPPGITKKSDEEGNRVTSEARVDNGDMQSRGKDSTELRADDPVATLQATTTESTFQATGEEGKDKNGTSKDAHDEAITVSSSDEDVDGETLASFMASTRSCFLDSNGNLKTAEHWRLEFKRTFPEKTIPRRISMLILLRCLLDLLAKEQCSEKTLLELGAFVSDMVSGSAFDILIKHLATFLTFGKLHSVPPTLQLFLGAGSLETVVAASKLLAAVCQVSANSPLLLRITYRILRWSQMENVILLAILASISSVTKQLLAETGTENLLTCAVRCFASELVGEVDPATLDVGPLVQLGVNVDETVQAVVQSVLHLLVNSSEFPVIHEASIEVMKSEAPSSWHSSFRLATEALELVALQMGWAWTYNELIVGKLWNLVSPGASQTTVASFAYLLGRLGSLGRNGEDMPGVDELRKRLVAILTTEQGGLKFPARLVAARALLELCIVDKTPCWGDEHSGDVEILHPESIKTLREWYQGLDTEQQAGVPLVIKKRIL